MLPGKDTTFPLSGHTESLYAWDTSPGTQKKKVFKIHVSGQMSHVAYHLSPVVCRYGSSHSTMFFQRFQPMLVSFKNLY